MMKASPVHQLISSVYQTTHCRLFSSPSALDDDDEDEGHTVVATARGIFNCNGGVLSSIETGVSIIIPQGAIPDSVEQEIYFKVCRDNSILPPLDKEKGLNPSAE